MNFSQPPTWCVAATSQRVKHLIQRNTCIVVLCLFLNINNATEVTVWCLHCVKIKVFGAVIVFQFPLMDFHCLWTEAHICIPISGCLYWTLCSVIIVWYSWLNEGSMKTCLRGILYIRVVFNVFHVGDVNNVHFYKRNDNRSTISSLWLD